jgi:hypothetical protein
MWEFEAFEVRLGEPSGVGQHPNPMKALVCLLGNDAESGDKSLRNLVEWGSLRQPLAR